MSEGMSLWSIMSHASWPVLLVVLLLVTASVTSWVVIIQRGVLIRMMHRSTQEFENNFWTTEDLSVLYHEIKEKESGAGLEQVFLAGFHVAYRELPQADEEKRKNIAVDMVIKEAQRAMRVAISREQERLTLHLPFLASVGSTCPYLGLLGTVIGIMNSFYGLGQVQQATLAAVAPGISEALTATAMGLVAAIPAVVAYNRYISQVDIIISIYETFSDELTSILHRKLSELSH